MAEKADVIVVGAGMAGMAAASKLQKVLSKVVVLEARADRIGGRVYTASMDNGKAMVDIGGAWLQYPKKNVVRHYLSGVEQHYTPPESALVYADTDVGTKPLTDAEVAQASKLMEGWMKDATAKAPVPKDLNTVTTTGALEVLPMLSQDAIVSGSADTLEKNAAIMMRTVIENYTAASVEDFVGIGVEGLAHVPPQNILKEGFIVAAKRLSQGLDIRMGHVVTRIETLSDGAGVRVSTAEGKVFEAPQVVVTLPIGVLKAGKVEFVPPLPERKQLAIRRLGVGVLNKVVLRFDSIFWPQDKHFFMYLTPDRSLAPMILNLAASTGEKILVCFHQGAYALANESLSDADLTEKAMVPLRKMFGDGIPAPLEVVCTRWGTDPYALGSYTSATVVPDGLCFTDQAALKTPVGKTLYFAGETTSEESAGLIHGAYATGVRAASEIMRDRGFYFSFVRALLNCL